MNNTQVSPKKNRLFRPIEIVSLVIILLLLLYIFHESILLAVMGFNRAGNQVTDMGVEADKTEYHVLQNQHGDELPRFVYMKETGIGICYPFMLMENDVASPDEVKRYYWKKQSPKEEAHLLYMSTGAKQYMPNIDFLLPNGVHSEIFRSGEQYIVHLWYEGGDFPEGCDFASVYEILKSCRCFEERT